MAISPAGLIRFTLLAMLIWLPFFLPTRFLIGDPTGFPVLHNLLIIALFMAVALPLFRHGLVTRLDKLVALYFIYYNCIFFVSVVNIGVIDSLVQYRVFVLNILIYFIIRAFYYRPGFSQSIGIAFVVSATLVAAYQVIEFINVNLYRHEPISLLWFQHIIEGDTSRARFFEFYSDIDAASIPGVFAYTHPTGFFIGAAGIFMFSLLLGKTWKPMVIPIALLMLVGLFLSSTRLAIVVAIALAAATFYVLLSRRRATSKPRAFIVVPLAAIAVLTVYVVSRLFPIYYQSRFVAYYKPSQWADVFSQVFTRDFGLYQEFLSAIPIAIFTGTGFPAKEFVTGGLTIASNDLYFLAFLSQVGLIGGGLLLLINITAFQYARRLVKSGAADGALAWGAFVAFAMLTLSMAHSQVVIFTGINQWYYALLAILGTCYENNRRTALRVVPEREDNGPQGSLGSHLGLVSP